jgi:hypothetical protein
MEILSGDLEITRQTPDTLTVQNAEGDHLGRCSKFTCDLVFRHPIYLRGHIGMDISTLVDGHSQSEFLGEHNHDPDLNLGIVRLQDQTATASVTRDVWVLDIGMLVCTELREVLSIRRG